MKALSLWQPWASYVAHRMKRFETRSWTTPYRGPLAIHAAKRPLTDGERELLEDYPLPYGAGPLPFGAVVATCRLVDVLPTTKAMAQLGDEREYNLGDYSPGRFAWVLLDVARLPEPIIVRGAQGLWDWPAPEDEKPEEGD